MISLIAALLFVSTQGASYEDLVWENSDEVCEIRHFDWFRTAKYVETLFVNIEAHIEKHVLLYKTNTEKKIPKDEKLKDIIKSQKGRLPLETDLVPQLLTFLPRLFVPVFHSVQSCNLDGIVAALETHNIAKMTNEEACSAGTNLRRFEHMARIYTWQMSEIATQESVTGTQETCVKDKELEMTDILLFVLPELHFCFSRSSKYSAGNIVLGIVNSAQFLNLKQAYSSRYYDANKIQLFDVQQYLPRNENICFSEEDGLISPRGFDILMQHASQHCAQSESLFRTESSRLKQIHKKQTAPILFAVIRNSDALPTLLARLGGDSVSNVVRIVLKMFFKLISVRYDIKDWDNHDHATRDMITMVHTEHKKHPCMEVMVIQALLFLTSVVANSGYQEMTVNSIVKTSIPALFRIDEVRPTIARRDRMKSSIVCFGNGLIANFNYEVILCHFREQHSATELVEPRDLLAELTLVQSQRNAKRDDTSLARTTLSSQDDVSPEYSCASTFDKEPFSIAKFFTTLSFSEKKSDGLAQRTCTTSTMLNFSEKKTDGLAGQYELKPLHEVSSSYGTVPPYVSQLPSREITLPSYLGNNIETTARPNQNDVLPFHVGVTPQEPLCIQVTETVKYNSDQKLEATSRQQAPPTKVKPETTCNLLDIKSCAGKAAVLPVEQTDLHAPISQELTFNANVQPAQIQPLHTPGAERVTYTQEELNVPNGRNPFMRTLSHRKTMTTSYFRKESASAVEQTQLHATPIHVSPLLTPHSKPIANLPPPIKTKPIVRSNTLLGSVGHLKLSGSLHDTTSLTESLARTTLTSSREVFPAAVVPATQREALYSTGKETVTYSERNLDAMAGRNQLKPQSVVSSTYYDGVVAAKFQPDKKEESMNIGPHLLRPTPRASRRFLFESTADKQKAPSDGRTIHVQPLARGNSMTTGFPTEEI